MSAGAPSDRAHIFRNADTKPEAAANFVGAGAAERNRPKGNSWINHATGLRVKPNPAAIMVCT